MRHKKGPWLSLFALAMALSACASAPPLPEGSTLVAPTPIQGNTGEFMSPVTADNTVAAWVRSMKEADEWGDALGSAAGIGVSFIKNLGIFGSVAGLVADSVVDDATQAALIQSAGGMEAVKSTSNLSFRSLEELAVYLHAKCDRHQDYGDMVSAAVVLYPSLAQVREAAIRQAGRRHTPSQGRPQ